MQSGGRRSRVVPPDEVRRLICRREQSHYDHFIAFLKIRIDIKDLGLAKNILGIVVEQTDEHIAFDQYAYVTKILGQHLRGTKFCDTPTPRIISPD